jgi:hypothetical protein
MNLKNIPSGWWVQVSPLAKIDPDDWIVAKVVDNRGMQR